MQPFKNLDVVEILKIGAIGLGFLLALMSFTIIKNEQRKPKPSSAVLKTARSFMFFSLVLMVLGIISEFVKSKSSLSIRLGKDEIELNGVAYASASSLSPNAYYINSQFDFAFKKPSKDWSKIASENGIAGLFKIMGMKSKIITEEALNEGIKHNPLGPLFSRAAMFYFYDPESKKQIVITDSTGNDFIDDMIKQKGEELSDTTRFGYDTTKPKQKREYLDDLASFRRNAIGFDTAEIKDAFLLTAYPKDALPLYLKKLKLPGFYTSYASFLGQNSDKLVADNNQILVGSEIKLEKVKVENVMSSIQSKMWLLFTENDKYFFVIEITFYPQVSSSIGLWDELQEILNSFTMINDN